MTWSFSSEGEFEGIKDDDILLAMQHGNQNNYYTMKQLLSVVIKVVSKHNDDSNPCY